MAPSPGPLAFKYRFVRGAQASGFRAKKGTVGERGLQLDVDELPYAAVAETQTRDNRLIVALRPSAQPTGKLAESLIDGNAFVLEIYGKKADDVERAIDRHASRVEAEAHKRALEERGEGGKYRAHECPMCSAVVDVSELPETRYVYCRFCLGLFDARKRAIVGEPSYRTCDQCGLYDRVQGYTEFYFYFLVVLYGFRYTRRHMCDACAGKLFWKVLAINSIFVLGVPPALWLKLKSMSGKKPEMKKLAKANALAKNGKHAEADAEFAEILRAFPDHPGVLFNQALGHVTGGDARGATKFLERALASCSNYGPAIGLVAQVAGGASGALPNDSRA